MHRPAKQYAGPGAQQEAAVDIQRLVRGKKARRTLQLKEMLIKKGVPRDEVKRCNVDCSYFCSSGSRLNSMVLARSAHDLKSRVRCDLNNQQTRLGIVATAHMPFDCFK